MPLTPEQIKNLLSKPARKKRGSGGPKVDTSVRDYRTWFKLQHRMFDIETHEPIPCENPNCIDPRETIHTAMGNSVKVQSCAEVNGKHMCRHCFLDGWLLENPDQTRLVS